MADEPHDSDQRLETGLSARVLAKLDQVSFREDERMKPVEVLVVLVDESIILDVLDLNLGCCWRCLAREALIKTKSA